MANEDAYYNINGQATGIRFFNGTPLIGGASVISIESNVSVIGGMIRAASFNAMSIDVSVLASIRKVNTAQVIIAIDSSNLTAGTEIRISGAYVNIESSLSVNAIKISKANSSLSSSLTSNFSAIKFKMGSSSLSIDSNLTSNPVKIKKVGSLITISSNYGIKFTTTYTADINLISFNLNASVLNLIRFTPNSRYPGSIVPLLYLDGKPLTEQNRKYNFSIKQVYVENKNWNNVKSRYYKRQSDGRISFRISWEWLPNSRDLTVDNRYARDYVKDIANDLDYHVLKVVEYGENPEDIFNEQEYNVFITNYSEDLIRRDLVSGAYLWNCSLDLEQI